MPPKKRARLASTAASAASNKGTLDERVQTTEGKHISAKDDNNGLEMLSNAWSDEQEISLFKGMIRWKPVGAFYFTDKNTLTVSELKS